MIWKTHHFDNLRVDVFREHAAAVCDVRRQVVQRRPLDFLALEIRQRVHEVERDAALPQLPDEQFLLL